MERSAVSLSGAVFMRQAFHVLAATALISSGVSAAALGQSTVSAEEVAKRTTVIVDFRELKEKANKVFGSADLGQPYSKMGLVFPSQAVDITANLSPTLPYAIRSTGVSTVDNANYQSIAFTTPQKVLGFTVRSQRATQIVVTVLDADGQVLDTQVLLASEESQFVGFIRPSADMTVVRVVAPHATIGDALASPTFISGISFSMFADGETESTRLSGDLGLAGAVGAPGNGVSQSAVAFAGNSGFGVGGAGGAGAGGGGRNPGNRNPNLPPAIIPEPAGVAVLAIPAAAMLLRRRRPVV